MSDTKESRIRSGSPPEGHIDPSVIGSGSPTKPDDDQEYEVGGRAIVHYAMRCYKCESITWINYDTENYKAYSCSHCGAVNVL
jgi:hypothetical protein